MKKETLLYAVPLFVGVALVVTFGSSSSTPANETTTSNGLDEVDDSSWVFEEYAVNQSSPAVSRSLLAHQDDDDANANDLHQQYRRRLLNEVDEETLRRYHAAPSGYRRHPSYYSDKYLTRSSPVKDQAALDDKWGKWTLVDKDRSKRPGEDFYAQYPQRDVPWADFPDTAWQKDAAYLPKFLDEGIALADRTLEAILTEYGRGADRDDRPLEERIQIFRMSHMLGDSYQGLVRRILHAIVTEDTFVFAMAGHSAAAGHGNHFQQSYTHVLGATMEPVFARLGVHSSSRNFGYGGMGTLQNGMSVAGTMGPDIDYLFWDSAMTERPGPQVQILLLQGLLGGDRIPLLCLNMGAGALKNEAYIKDKLFADFSAFDHGQVATKLAPRTETLEELEALPYAAQCQNFGNDLKNLCPRHYSGVCWLNRTGFHFGGEDMSYTPQNTRQKEPGGRAGWHPGDKVHQINGRAMAGEIIFAIRDALLMWKNSENMVLKDEDWHVSEYYARTWAAYKEKHLEEAGVVCAKANLPKRLCQVPMQGASEFHRYDAARTNIRRLLKVNASPGLKIKPAVYDPPDVYNPKIHPPEGALDVLQVAENGVPFAPNLGRIRRRDTMLPVDWEVPTTGASVNPEIVPGKGWGFAQRSTHNRILAGHDMCDGEYDSWCKRDNANPCMLYAQNDGRTGLHHDSLSGWAIFELPNMREGLIILGFQDWVGGNENAATEGWKTVNNEVEAGRRLGTPPPYCDDFQFQFAIDGKITTWSKEWIDSIKVVERVVQISTVFDDPTYLNGETRNVEFAMRITGCGRTKTHSLTHLYWA